MQVMCMLCACLLFCQLTDSINRQVEVYFRVINVSSYIHLSYPSLLFIFISILYFYLFVYFNKAYKSDVYTRFCFRDLSDLSIINDKLKWKWGLKCRRKRLFKKIKYKKPKLSLKLSRGFCVLVVHTVVATSTLNR